MGGSSNRVAKEIRELAKKAAPDAIRTLIALVENGSAAVRVQAAKAVLGIAGVPLAPSQNVKHQHELLPPPASMSVRELIALVRAQGAPGAMPRLSLSPGTPDCAPDGSVGGIAQPRTGPFEAEYREITEDSSRPASYDAPASSCPSGSQPDAPAGQASEKTEDSAS